MMGTHTHTFPVFLSTFSFGARKVERKTSFESKRLVKRGKLVADDAVGWCSREGNFLMSYVFLFQVKLANLTAASKPAEKNKRRRRTSLAANSFRKDL